MRVAQIEVVEDAGDAVCTVCGGDCVVVLVRECEVLRGIRMQVGRLVEGKDGNIALGEVGLQVLPVAVVFLAEEQDGVDREAAQMQRLERGDGRGYTAEFGVPYEDGGEEERAVEI